jgi:hypothetical protein
LKAKLSPSIKEWKTKVEALKKGPATGTTTSPMEDKPPAEKPDAMAPPDMAKDDAGAMK